MIDIRSFREFCVEIAADVNDKSVAKIDGLKMAVTESHLTKKLLKSRGICLCATYPFAQGQGEPDNLSDKQTAFFFVVRKTSPDASEDEEIKSYAELQTIMLFVRDAVRNASSCLGIMPEDSYRIEWEYQIFGGFNGLSMSIKFTNND